MMEMSERYLLRLTRMSCMSKYQEREPKSAMVYLKTPKRNRAIRYKRELPAQRPDSLVGMSGRVRCIVAIACDASCSGVRSKLQ